MISAPVRRSLAGSLRNKIAGPDGQQAAERIWRTEGERWFAPGDPIWRVHSDASMFTGGVRALLLQSLHPLAMYGVAEHSGYQDDPWARVASTSTYIATTTFATIEHAEAAIAKVRSIHRYVRGTTPDGLAYSADDPRLLLWVHVAEIDSFLTTQQAFGRRPLTADEADTYVAQAGLPATRLGVEDAPRTVAELRATIEAYRPELEVTPPALDAARLVLHEPPLSRWARPVYGCIATAAVATLPALGTRHDRRPGAPVRDADRSRHHGRGGVGDDRARRTTPGRSAQRLTPQLALACVSRKCEGMVGRIPVMDVTPLVEHGRYPAKASVGEVFPVTALVFREGHDELGCDVVLTDPGGVRRPPVRMTRIPDQVDRYTARVTADSRGRLDVRGAGVERPAGDLAALHRGQGAGRCRRRADVHRGRRCCSTGWARTPT